MLNTWQISNWIIKFSVQHTNNKKTSPQSGASQKQVQTSEIQLKIVFQELFYRQKNSKQVSNLKFTFRTSFFLSQVHNAKNDYSSMSFFCITLLEFPLAGSSFSETWIIQIWNSRKCFLLIFRNSEIVNNLKMAVMSIFSKRNKGKNSDTPLPQSIEIGYHKNKKSVTTYVFECSISSLKPVVFQIYWLQTLRKWKYRFFKRSRDFT